MILVDTSLWIDHLRAAEGPLATLLETDLVCTHAWIVGELACGNLQNRREVLGMLQALPTLTAATDEEVLYFIEQRQLMGRGIGYIDVHLLTAAAIHSVRLLTRDKRLKAVAEELGLAYAADSH